MRSDEIDEINVSVCMATFNGEQFVREQVATILSQLSRHDELVVVDDCSSDGTVSIVDSFADPRIVIYRNERNIGVIKSFEKALTLASGEYIFLADQDDAWLPGKVENMVQLMDPNKIMAVVCDCQVVDSFGESLLPSYFKFRGSGPGFFHNFVKNSYLGCAMAFTKEARRYILPFPRNIPMHDEWVGMVCDLLGIVVFEPKVLFMYRRHGANVTGMSRASWLKVIGKRVKWIRLAIFEVPRRWMRGGWMDSVNR